MTQISTQSKHKRKLDGCIVWNAHNTVLGEEALLIYIVPVCYVKTGRSKLVRTRISLRTKFEVPSFIRSKETMGRNFSK